MLFRSRAIEQGSERGSPITFSLLYVHLEGAFQAGLENCILRQHRYLYATFDDLRRKRTEIDSLHNLAPGTFALGMRERYDRATTAGFLKCQLDAD